MAGRVVDSTLSSVADPVGVGGDEGGDVVVGGGAVVADVVEELQAVGVEGLPGVGGRPGVTHELAVVGFDGNDRSWGRCF